MRGFEIRDLPGGRTCQNVMPPGVSWAGADGKLSPLKLSLPFREGFLWRPYPAGIIRAPRECPQ